jgi:hypothetical protein
MNNLHSIPEKPTRRSRKRNDADQLRAAAGMDADQRKQPPKLDDEREMLVVLRTELKARIKEAPTHAIAALIRQFREIDRDIRAMDAKAARDAAEASGTGGDDDWDDDI